MNNKIVPSHVPSHVPSPANVRFQHNEQLPVKSLSVLHLSSIDNLSHHPIFFRFFKTCQTMLPVERQFNNTTTAINILNIFNLKIIN